ncbi:hypothetical protein Tsubulata_026058 [Turnera subulata]|uniref:Uncharacterized protein n=1 Tax=Turnera subulata TaxID=218843 RepID=A0A9Q0FQG1_9ROSI|nr:hypothetical protein Tsubulata_026058 [Turnera subulata]
MAKDLCMVGSPKWRRQVFGDREWVFQTRQNQLVELGGFFALLVVKVLDMKYHSKISRTRDAVNVRGDAKLIGHVYRWRAHHVKNEP